MQWEFHEIPRTNTEKLLDFLGAVKYHHDGTDTMIWRGGEVSRIPSALVQKESWFPYRALKKVILKKEGSL